MTDPIPADPSAAAGSDGDPATAPTAAPVPAPKPAAAPGVAAAAAVLDALAERPLHEHPDAYGRIHADLHAALTSIDDA